MNAPDRIMRASATLAACVLLCCAVASAQSGRGMMHGYVEFEDISYNDLPASNVRAKIELRGATKFNHGAYTAETDGHGIYEIKLITMGEYTLRISAPGYQTYETTILIPSDFECRLAVTLKQSRVKSR